MPALEFDLLKPEEALGRLERGEDLPGVVACLGGEAYFQRLLVDGLQRVLTKRSGQPVERISYAAGEPWDPAQVMAPLSSLSLFGQGTLVKITQVEQLSLETCEELWKLSPPTSDHGLLLMVGQKFPKDFSPSSGWVVSAETPRRESLKDWFPWVDRMAKVRGVSLEAEGRSALVDAAETLAEIDQELEKLSLVFPDGGVIRRTAVEQHTSGRAHVSIYELMPALVDRNVDEAMATLKTLLEDGEEGLRLLVYITNEWNLLWEANGLTVRRATSAEAMRQLGVSSGRWFHLERTARRMTPDRLAGGIEAMMEADLSLKTSDGEAAFVWERLVYRLCGVV